MTNQNKDLIESTKRLLFEQHSASDRSYSSQQDSLDKAFTTILFAEIAFYASKIISNECHIWIDIILYYNDVGYIYLYELWSKK